MAVREGNAALGSIAKFSPESFVFNSIAEGSFQIVVGPTGTLIHTASTVFKDELWMYAYNIDSVDRLLTLQFGGVTTTDEIDITIEPKTFVKSVLPGMVLGNGAELRAFADAPDVVQIIGNVIRW